MIKLYKIFGKKVLLLSLWLITISWASVASYHAHKNSNRILVVEVNEFGTKIAQPEENTPLEVENFLNNFVGLFYSYTGLNYESHIDRAVDMLDQQVLLAYSDRLNKKFEKIVGTHFSQSAVIYEIKRVGRFRFDLTIEMSQQEKTGAETTGKFLLAITLEQVPRSLRRPYGLKVKSLEEKDV